jgi:hypothetical protein
MENLLLEDLYFLINRRTDTVNKTLIGHSTHCTPRPSPVHVSYRSTFPHRFTNAGETLSSVSPPATVNLVCVDDTEGFLKDPTSPRIVTSKQYSKHAWMWPIVLSIFIHKQPIFTLSSPFHCPNSFQNQYSFINNPFSPYRPLSMVRIPSRTPLHDDL